MSTNFSKDYLFKLANETGDHTLVAFKNADLRYSVAAQQAYKSAEAAEEAAADKEDRSDAAYEAIEAKLQEVIKKEIDLRKKLADAKATCEIDTKNWQKAYESLTRADEACDCAEKEARRLYDRACTRAEAILKERAAGAAEQERQAQIKLLREKIAELEQGASSAESGAESGASSSGSPASAAASPLAEPSAPTKQMVKRLIQQGRKRLPAAYKKWKLKVQRELIPGWKVQIIVRKTGANAGAHVLKFTARNGKKFDSFVKAKAYDLKLRGTPRPEIRV